MNLNDVHRGVHTHRARKRIGRGTGSGRGKTSGRGHKGQGSRAGVSFRPVFQGGTMPLVRRIPKRGFHHRGAAHVAILNVSDLEHAFQPGDDVNLQSLAAAGLLKGRFDELKILGSGNLTKKLQVAAHRFSKSAAEKITQAGGQTTQLPTRAPVVKNKSKPTGELPA